MIGFLNVDKPSGYTSAKVVAMVKHNLHVQKIGHMGTLDPMAQGVLPIAIGKACRMFDYMNDKQKKYRATFSFGWETDTLDADGQLLHSCGNIPNIDQIRAILPSLIGDIDQLPPRFSAKKVNGKRAYDLARENVDFELQPKRVKIFDIKLVDCNGENFVFDIVCSAGTYIRSIAKDMASLLGTYATMTKLVRTKSGYFDIQSSKSPEAITLDDIVPIDKVFDFPKLNFYGEDAVKIKNGVAVPVNQDDNIVFVYIYDKLYGVGQIVNNELKIKTNLYEE